VRRKFSKAIRWILRVDTMVHDSVLEEYLRRNRQSLDRKRQDWMAMKTARNLST